MAELPGVTVTVEDELGEQVDFTVRFLACAFSTDDEAKAAWEAGQEAAREGNFGISIWRTKYPRRPPHTAFYVISGGETEEGVEASNKVVGSMPGAEPWELVDEDFMQALALRRIRQGVEALESSGMRTGKVMSVIRTPAGRVMAPDGTMAPAERPQG